MTTRCAYSSGVWPTLYFYDELPAEERARFAAHVAGCDACAGVLAELEVIRETLSSRAVAARVEDWNAFMTRLDRAIEDDSSRSVHSGPASFREFRSSASRTRSDAIRPAPGRRLAAYPAFAVAAALVLAVALGLMWQRRTLDSGDASTTSSGAPPLARADRHLDRARLVVLGLAARDPNEAEPSDWAYERELAGSLLPETRLLRLVARDRGDERLADLLGDLETVLLQASMSDDPDAPALQRLQRLISRRDLIGRMDLRETAHPEPAGGVRVEGRAVEGL